MTRIYVDRLSMAAVGSLALRGLARSADDTLRWLDSTPTGLHLLGDMRLIGRIRADAAPADFRLAEVRDERGSCRFQGIAADLRDLVRRIDAEVFARHPFLGVLEPALPAERVRFTLRKALAEDLAETVAFADFARWGDGEPLLLIEHSPWSSHVAALARSRGMAVVQYASASKAWRARYSGRIRGALARRSRADGAVATARPEPAEVTREMPRAEAPAIASWYTARSVTFDRARRSDLFWALDAPVPRPNLMVYWDRPSLPVTAADADALAAEGIEPLALTAGASVARGVRVHAPGRRVRRMKAGLAARIAAAWAYSLYEGRWPNVFLTANAYYFATQYAWWTDFFESAGVRVSVSPYDFTRPYAAKNLALERLGGVSVSYQWSNIDVGTVEMSGCSDAMFSFGPAYWPVFREAGSQIGRLLYGGYVTDHAFEAVKPAASELRSALEAAGARQVVALLDENSSNGRMQVITNERARSWYRPFLERVTADPEFGLVIKPGYPLTLRDRLGEETCALLDAALATGRAVMLDRGTWVTEQYPAEAAAAADVCVGLLMSGTAALECRLAGAPTVFLDMERLHYRDVYEWGAGTVVFETPEAVLAAIDRRREHPRAKASKAFGDLTRWAECRVELRDGRAAERIGTYVAWLHETLAAGGTRDEALAEADRRYAESWGEGSVVPWR